VQQNLKISNTNNCPADQKQQNAGELAFCNICPGNEAVHYYNPQNPQGANICQKQNASQQYITISKNDKKLTPTAVALTV